MNLRRGDVVLAWYPFTSGQGGKRRPCVIVQNAEDKKQLATRIIAQITSTLRRTGDKSHVLVTANTPEGRQTGLLHDSLNSCNNLATIEQALVAKVIGSLPDALMRQADDCLKAALQIP